MDSPMLKMLKTKNPDKEYPSNTGQKWTDKEDATLLEELSNDIDIQLISQQHKRTIGGINARRKEIAYKLYNNNTPMEEIILKTKLDKDQIVETIKKRQNATVNATIKYNPAIEITEPPNIPSFAIEKEISEMKNDIKELKKAINELTEMLNAIYEFQDV